MGVFQKFLEKSLERMAELFSIGILEGIAEQYCAIYGCFYMVILQEFLLTLEVSSLKVCFENSVGVPF